MPLRLYNSLTKQKEPFEPISPDRVLFYSCGPTVYGEFHVGNARTFVLMDVVRRWLLARGYNVRYAQNITDVDDKIINKARETGTTPEAVAEKYTAFFLQRLGQLGIMPADAHPKATEHIAPMVGMIERLVEKKHAYATPDGSVWFEVGSFAEYGKLSRMPLDQMQQGERVDDGIQRLKRSPLDFSLWKAAKPGEPSWPSPWGAGRPGWHIECSCMSMSSLGRETLDIHGGGSDLRFPHHENEIAQSECATGKPFAKYWLHAGMLDIDGEKMSKSIGNIAMVDQALAYMGPLALRFFLLGARYRDTLDYSEANLHAAKSAVQRLIAVGAEAKRLGIDTSPLPIRIEGDAIRGAEGAGDTATKAIAEFVAALDDDVNVAGAIGQAMGLAGHLYALFAKAGDAGVREEIRGAAGALAWMRETLGIGANLEAMESAIGAGMTEAIRALAKETEADAGGADAEALIAGLIERRAAARRAKQFAVGDTIRKRLGEIGIALEDKPGGVTVWRVSKGTGA